MKKSGDDEKICKNREIKIHRRNKFFFQKISKIHGEFYKIRFFDQAFFEKTQFF